VKWFKRGYDTNKTLSRMSPDGDALDGFIRFLRRWRTMVGAEVWAELYNKPSSQRTSAVLRTVGGIGGMPNMVTRCLLGLYDPVLFNEHACHEALSGAQPVLDWLVGDTVDWATHRQLTYRPVRGRNYGRLLALLTDQLRHLKDDWSLPSWVSWSLQLLEHACCEYRKYVCEQAGATFEAYVASPGYNTLFRRFEDTFVTNGEIVPVLRREPCAPQPVSLADSGDATIRGGDRATAGPPPPKRRRKYAGITCWHGGRPFKTLSDFCRHCQPVQTSSSSAGRRRLEDAVAAHRVSPTDVLILPDVHNTKILQWALEGDLAGDARAMLLQGVGDRRCSTMRR